MSPASLRAVVLAATGQDVRRCSHCGVCAELASPGQDISLEMLVQMVVLNDEEVLTCRALWSGEVLATAPDVCPNNLNMKAVFMTLRREARRRGLAPPLESGAAPAAAIGGGDG